MIRLTTTQVQPIGVDIGFDSIKMMQLETVGDSLSVHVAARLPIPQERAGTRRTAHAGGGRHDPADVPAESVFRPAHRRRIAARTSFM